MMTTEEGEALAGEPWAGERMFLSVELSEGSLPVLAEVQQTLTRRRRVKTVVGQLRASDCSSLVLPMKQVLGQVSGGLPHTRNAVSKLVIHSM